MNRSIRRSLAFFCVVLIFSGCSVNRAIYIPYESKVYPAKSFADPILLIYEPDRPYEVLGTVLAYGKYSDDFDHVNDLLRDQARQIGADAIINLRYKPEHILTVGFILSFGFSVASGEGIAVRYTDKK